MSNFLLFFQNQGGGGSFLVAIMPWILIFGVFYFLLIVPQRKRQRALQEMIQNLKTGDRIVTTGGVVGTITAVRDNTLLIRSGDKSILEVSRGAVAAMQEEEEKKL